jgi:hypothetical protein
MIFDFLIIIAIIMFGGLFELWFFYFKWYKTKFLINIIMINKIKFIEDFICIFINKYDK